MTVPHRPNGRKGCCSVRAAVHIDAGHYLDCGICNHASGNLRSLQLIQDTPATLLGLHGIKPPIKSIHLRSGSIPEYMQGNLESGSERWWRCAECMRADAAYPDKNMSTNFNKPFQTFFSFHPARSSYRKVGSSSATNCQSAPPFLKFAMILELVSCCWNEAEDTRGIRKCAVRMFSRPRFSFGREQGIVYPRLDIWDGST